jgi:hypothetical protein
MKLLKLFIFSLAVFPLVALSMEQDIVVTCEGRTFSTSSVKDFSLRSELVMYFAHRYLKQAHLDYILNPQRVEKFIKFNVKFSQEDEEVKILKLSALFEGEHIDYEYLIFDSESPKLQSPKPYYLNKKLWIAAAFVGLGYYYRHAIANGMHDFLSGLRSARSFIAQEAAPRVNALFGRVKSFFSR